MLYISLLILLLLIGVIMCENKKDDRKSEPPKPDPRLNDIIKKSLDDEEI